MFTLFFLCHAGAEIQLTPHEDALLEETSFFRMDLGLSKTCEDAVARIDAKLAELDTPEFSSQISAEVKLVLENILVWEKYNYLYESDIKHPALEKLITDQYLKVKAWFKTYKDKPHNKWLYCTAGDILSCCMQFLPLTTAMSEGLTIKKYYDAALEQDPEMAFCLINIAQWYFYAPAISGGGKKKAQRFFEQAVAAARNTPEQYYAQALLSQILFETESSAACSAMLENARALQPKSRYIARLDTINEAGYSWFEYTMNREKADKKIYGK